MKKSWPEDELGKSRPGERTGLSLCFPSGARFWQPQPHPSALTLLSLGPGTMSQVKLGAGVVLTAHQPSRGPILQPLCALDLKPTANRR